MGADLRGAPALGRRVVLGAFGVQPPELRQERLLGSGKTGKDCRGAVGGHLWHPLVARPDAERDILQYNAPFQSWNITSPSTISSRARSRFSTSKSSSASSRGRRRRPKSCAGCNGRSHLILLANAPLPDDPGSVVPVSFKVAHEIRVGEPADAKLADLVTRLEDHVQFDGRRVLYTWIGGTRRDWRGQGHFRALTEQQELWAIAQGFDEIVVKTKNKFYEMRGTLDHLRFEVVKYERNQSDNAQSKVYLSKKLSAEVLDAHRSAKTVVQVAGITMAPTTNYSKDLGDREPLAAMRDNVHALRTSPRAGTRRSSTGRTHPASGPRDRSSPTSPTPSWRSACVRGWRSRRRTTPRRRSIRTLARPRNDRLTGPEAVAAFAGSAALNVALFEALSPADRAVSMGHPEYGAITVDWIIYLLAGHQIHHIAQLRT